MDYKPPYKTVATGPEAAGAARLRRYMEARHWYLEKLSGGIYQRGLPDYFACHFTHGLKWIETKAPGEKLRRSQEVKFLKMEQHGQLVYVLEDENDYPKLFAAQSNWRLYRRM